MMTKFVLLVVSIRQSINAMNTIHINARIESIFHTAWNQYMGALEMGIIHTPFPMVPAHIKKPTLLIEPRPVQYAGKYTTQDRTVYINSAYFPFIDSIESIESIDQSNCEQTVSHEIAHHLTLMIFPHFKQWHGPQFRHIMAGIGYRGDTYHKMSVSDAKARAVASRIVMKQKEKVSIIDLL